MKDIKVLTIEDDPIIQRLLEMTFRAEGAIVFGAQHGVEGLHRFIELRPDVVLLDIAMPEMDGWETLRRIRMLAQTPVIILTVHAQDHEIVQGLTLGADDYVTKPFSPEVLVARVRSVLRRRRPAEAAAAGRRTGYQDERLLIDLEEHRVYVDGAPLKLTGTELRLLEYLVGNVGRVLTFRQILENVWGWSQQDEPEQVRLYIWRLRQKLELDPRNPQYIVTEYGVGYRFEPRMTGVASLPQVTP
ncbi:MAG TPA: DNA-binding response regulator [Chloroflexi bacterium]|nr:DNA-binding response regulator [Chloroflexota bacterium]HHW87732.1 response regulator transcription factor [Chloroflexota bacterium]